MGTIINTLLDLLCIAWLCVFVIDCSGVIDSIESTARRYYPLFRVPKPFSCSLCSTWWYGLLYLAIVGRFTLGYIAICALFAYLTPQIRDIIQFVADCAVRVIDWLNKAKNE